MVGAAVDVCAVVEQIRRHGLGDARRFREGSRGMIEIDSIHNPSSENMVRRPAPDESRPGLRAVEQ